MDLLTRHPWPCRVAIHCTVAANMDTNLIFVHCCCCCCIRCGCCCQAQITTHKIVHRKLATIKTINRAYENCGLARIAARLAGVKAGTGRSPFNCINCIRVGRPTKSLRVSWPERVGRPTESLRVSLPERVGRPKEELLTRSTTGNLRAASINLSDTPLHDFNVGDRPRLCSDLSALPKCLEKRLNSLHLRSHMTQICISPMPDPSIAHMNIIDIGLRRLGTGNDRCDRRAHRNWR